MLACFPCLFATPYPYKPLSTSRYKFKISYPFAPRMCMPIRGSPPFSPSPCSSTGLSYLPLGISPIEYGSRCTYTDIEEGIVT